MTTETRNVRLKRLKMRSMRRGIKEMDLILSGFADASLAGLDEDALRLYDALLSENDHDIYQWITTQRETPAEYLALVTQIADHQRASHKMQPDI